MVEMITPPALEHAVEHGAPHAHQLEVAARCGLHLREANPVGERRKRVQQSGEILDEIEVGLHEHWGDVVHGQLVDQQDELLGVLRRDGVDVLRDGLRVSDVSGCTSMSEVMVLMMRQYTDRKEYGIRCFSSSSFTHFIASRLRVSAMR